MPYFLIWVDWHDSILFHQCLSMPTAHSPQPTAHSPQPTAQWALVWPGAAASEDGPAGNSGTLIVMAWFSSLWRTSRRCGTFLDHAVHPNTPPDRPRRWCLTSSSSIRASSSTNDPRDTLIRYPLRPSARSTSADTSLLVSGTLALTTTKNWPICQRRFIDVRRVRVFAAIVVAHFHVEATGTSGRHRQGHGADAKVGNHLHSRQRGFANLDACAGTSPVDL
jgi:hypothetical protein